MPGEHAEGVGLSADEEMKRCMLEAMDRFRSETEERFSEVCMSNEVFGFLNPQALLRSKNIEEEMNKFKSLYADVNFSEFTLETARFNWLVQSSGSAFQSNATALDVLQWLTKYRYVNQHLICFCVLSFTSLLLFLLPAAKEVFQSSN